MLYWRFLDKRANFFIISPRDFNGEILVFPSTSYLKSQSNLELLFTYQKYRLGCQSGIWFFFEKNDNVPAATFLLDDPISIIFASHQTKIGYPEPKTFSLYLFYWVWNSDWFKKILKEFWKKKRRFRGRIPSFTNPHLSVPEFPHG